MVVVVMIRVVRVPQKGRQLLSRDNTGLKRSGAAGHGTYYRTTRLLLRSGFSPRIDASCVPENMLGLLQRGISNWGNRHLGYCQIRGDIKDSSF